MQRVYLEDISLPNGELEKFFLSEHYFHGGYYSSPYPFGLFPFLNLEKVSFSPITIFCGDNGTGKSTLLNIIARRLDIAHQSPFNDSVYLKEYVDRCVCNYNYQSPAWVMKIITSDDVFRRSFHHRELNAVTHDLQRDTHNEGLRLSQERLHVNFDDPESVARFRRQAVCKGRKGSAYKLVMKEVGRDIILHSNGENALAYFEEQLTPHGLYLLDEPENSLSIQRQLSLKELIEDMVQFEHCQFVIATHSPFLLALKGAKVYNLIEGDSRVQQWTQLEHVRAYFNFFEQYRSVFLKNVCDEEAECEDEYVSAKQSFWRVLAHGGYDYKIMESWVDSLGTPYCMNELVEWFNEYRSIHMVYPTEAEVDDAVFYTWDQQQRPIV